MSAEVQMTEGAMKAQLTALKSDVALIKEKAVEIAVIDSPEKEERAAEFCQQVKLRIDKAEDARTFLVKPLNDHVKRINAEFKETTGPMVEALDQVKKGMTAWRNSEQVREAKERAEEARLAAMSAAVQGDIPELQEQAVKVQEAQTIATKKVETNTGKTTFRKVWRYEVTDPLAVPAAYWVLDEKKIKSAVDAGIPVEGVKAWQEDVPVFGR